MLELWLEQNLGAAMIAGSRVTGLMLAAPFLSGASIPPRVKLGMAVLLTFLLMPLVAVHRAQLSTAALIPSLVGEIGVGVFLGLTLQLFFDAAQLAGQVLGVQMGYSLASVIDPQSQADSPVLSIFLQLIVLLLFIQLQVPHWLLRGLARSFEYLPPGTLSLKLPAVSALFHFAAAMWVAGVQIAAPVLVATIFTDVALGFLGKASPQLPVMFVGLSIKSLLGLAVLGGALSVWPRFFEARFQQALTASEQILRLAH